jgi:hypothetical protein
MNTTTARPTNKTQIKADKTRDQEIKGEVGTHQ